MSYRKRFPKGPDWEKPKPNPFDFEGTPRIPESSYHGMEVIGYMKNNACFICRLFRKLREIKQWLIKQWLYVSKHLYKTNKKR